jgi:hypothetical protein
MGLKMNGYKKYLVLAALSLFPLFMMAQDNDPDKLGAPNVIETGRSGNKHKMSANEKKAADTKARQKKEGDKMYKAALKQHEKNQSKNTREMMKASRKTSEKGRDNNKKPWWKRIF